MRFAHIFAKSRRPTPNYRRLAAITHEALNASRFATVADLADVVKAAAARQHIPYDGRSISAALAYVGFRRPLTVAVPVPVDVPARTPRAWPRVASAIAHMVSAHVKSFPTKGHPI